MNIIHVPHIVPCRFYEACGYSVIDVVVYNPSFCHASLHGELIRLLTTFGFLTFIATPVPIPCGKGLHTLRRCEESQIGIGTLAMFKPHPSCLAIVDGGFSGQSWYSVGQLRFARRDGGGLRGDLKTQSGGTTLIFVVIHENPSGIFCRIKRWELQPRPSLVGRFGAAAERSTAEGSWAGNWKLSELDDLTLLPANKGVYVC